MMLNAYNPWKPGLEPFQVFESTRQVDNGCIALAASIQMENAKREGSSPDVVCAIHRHKGIHRWFVINDRKNPGAMTLLQKLFEGEWRIATADEEIACRAQDEKEREIELKRRADASAVVFVQKAAANLAQSMESQSAPPTAEGDAPKGKRGKKAAEAAEAAEGDAPKE